MLWRNKEEFQFKVLLTLYHFSFSMYKFNFMSIPNPDSLWIYSSDQPSPAQLLYCLRTKRALVANYNPRWVDINNGAALHINSTCRRERVRQSESSNITTRQQLWKQSLALWLHVIIFTVNTALYNTLVLGGRNNTPVRMLGAVLCCELTEKFCLHSRWFSSFIIFFYYLRVTYLQGVQ